MAKKPADVEFNMSEAIRSVLDQNPASTSQEVIDAIVAKHPKAAIKKASFSVAFYTIRKKMGIGGKRRTGKLAARKSRGVASSTTDLKILQATAQFLRDVGGAEAALEAIKQVQAVQLS